jgi:muramoyltetrapeptide carboxypeptidase
MLDCIQSKDQEYRLQEVIMRVVGDLGIPIAYGLPSGHVSRKNVTLPIGVQSELQVGKEVTLKILEAATSAVPAASVHAGKR